jgi:hypothetical protein
LAINIKSAGVGLSGKRCKPKQYPNKNPPLRIVACHGFLMDFNGMRWWGGFLFGIDCGAIYFFDKPAPTALMH